MSGTSTGLIEQLTRNSAPYHDPLTRIDWESLDRRAFWLPEPALSLYGLPQYVALGEAQRQTLSQYEFINFLMAGLWLEGLFMHRISATLLEPVGNLTRHIYHLHELREETGHSLMFLELMRRAHLPLHEPRFWRLGLVNALGRYAPFESVLFWVAVLIGEEVPDRLNRYVRNHRDSVCPAIYDIVTVHTIDEARHIAHARETLITRLEGMPGWQRALLRPLLRVAFRQFVQVFYYPGPEMYELVGLTPGREWARKARHNPHRRRFVRETLQSTLRILRERGLALAW